MKFAQNGSAPNGRIVAFRLRDEGGKLSLEPVWQSQDFTSPLAPIVVDGMVFAVSSGEYRGGPASLSAAQRAQRSGPAVLYVLDAATGRAMWNSSTKITSFARGGLSAGGGQVYVVTYDNQLYAFGIPLEH
jgi:outer membrane protein assembly factor BamB